MPTPLERALRPLGGLLIALVCALILYVVYPTAGRYLELRALYAGAPAQAALVGLAPNPIALCHDGPLSAWRRCQGAGTAYTILELEREGKTYQQRYFPSRLVAPLGLRPGTELQVVQSGGRLLVDERAYGYVPLPSETLSTDLWILLAFSLPLAFFWWFQLNIGKVLYKDA